MSKKFIVRNYCKAKEKRQYNRYCVNFYMRIVDKTQNIVLGDVTDINIEGMKVISKTSIPTQTTYSVRMEVMIGERYQDQLDFETISIWSYKDIDPGLYETGFLNTLSIENVDKIQRLIDLIEEVEEP